MMTTTTLRRPARRRAGQPPSIDVQHSADATPITVDAVPLLAALERAVAFTSVDDAGLPMLNCVLLAYDGACTLTALATDRYIAARITLDVTPDRQRPAEPWAALVRRRDVTLISHAYRSGRSRATDAHLTLRLLDAGKVLHVAPAPFDGPSTEHLTPQPADPRTVTLTIRCAAEPYSGMESIFARHSGSTAGTPPTSRMSVAPELLARVARHAPKRQPMRLHLTGPNAAIRIEYGPDFTALLMPIRERADNGACFT